ncbi:MAG: hypothetical protein L0229_08115 [Blastocatellia bacterium]|nr:hypothetical protein [Blastocatellia bacterium]
MDDPERRETYSRLKLDSDAWTVFLIFLWLATLLALVSFLRETGSDSLASVYVYVGLSIASALSGGKRLYLFALEKIKAAFGRAPFFILIIVLWLASLIGIFTLFPPRLEYTLSLWAVWVSILVGNIRCLERRWQRVSSKG